MSAQLVPPFVPLAEILATPAPTAAWLWDGYLAAGKVTLLTSLWKAGKTTLLSVLLAKINGGGELAGRPVKAARPVVVSEESPDYWAERARRLNLSPDIPFLCQPFRAKPTPEQWQALVDRVDALAVDRPIDLLVIDPLATFLPGRNENSAGLMLEALLPLQTLTRRGVAVLLLHHPKKDAAEPGHAARGSGALSGHADILLELRPYPRAADADRRRRLCGLSRFAETPRQMIIELNPDATDYACLGEAADEAFAANWDVLHTVLSGASEKLTRQQIWEQWPVVELRPDEGTLWRWLERAVAEGKVQRTGTGHRGDAFHYWLKESEARWKRDPYYMEVPDSIQDRFKQKLPPLLPPNIQKLVDRERERRAKEG